MINNRTVALVGRPNVGKSRIFNRLAGRRLAIVHDQAGVTRDVNSTVVNNNYTLLDTGGIGLVVDMDHQKLIAAAEEQVWFAVETANLICFVVDVREGLTTYDLTIAEKLRSSGKQILLVVNKVDHQGMDRKIEEFKSLGFKAIFGVSAEHGFAFENLEEAIEGSLGPVPEKDKSQGEEQRIRLAFVGRPNVGKSSLCNRLFEHDRLVVSEVPGTTRDAVEIDLDFKSTDGQNWPFRLVDTAGLRRRNRVNHSIEYFSTLRSREAMEAADVIFHVIDAETGVTRQDKALAGEVVAAGKCICIVVNKWDLAVDKFRAEQPEAYETLNDFRKAYAETALEEIFFLPDAPVIFVSALTGLSIDRIFRVARQLWETSGRTLPTPKINKLVERLLEARQPKFVNNKQFKVYYGLQTGNRPFRFRLFCNRATRLDDGYKRYLQGSFIKEFKLSGCPVEFELKGKEVRYADKPKPRPSIKARDKIREIKASRKRKK